MRLRHLDLFSGIGGFSLGLEATGSFETVAFCDIEKYCLEILEKRFPGVPRYTDIKELTYDKLKADGIISKNKKIDIITGGYPCQPFSVAGRKKGEEDPRHLWPECFRLIKECRPTWVIGENVSGHIKLGLDTVLENLESEGYSARTFSISASSVGANHQRERVWIIANSKCNGLTTSEKRGGFEKTISNQSKGKNDTLNVKRTSSVSETSSDVENSRRSQWPRAEQRGENENETRKENANQFERSSSTSKFDVANTDNERLQRQWQSRNQFTPRFNSSRESSEEGQGTVGQGWWESEPNMGRVAHGIPKRVDRLKSLGNSLVPQIPYYIGKVILEVMNGKTN